MAAPVAAFIQTPSDSGNLGKKVRTQSRVVGSDTVHEHFFVEVSPRSIVSSLKATTGKLTDPAAVHNGTTTGFAWLFNPVGSAIRMAVKRINWNSQFEALAVDLLGGEMRLNLFTFTGTASGAQVTPAKAESTQAAAVGNLRTASTGLTVTLGAAVYGSQYQTMDLATGGAGHWNPALYEWKPFEEQEESILRPGEGVVAWKAVATTTGNRRLIINYEWEEYEV